MSDEVFGSFPVLETDRLVLREFRAADAPATFEMLSDPETMRFSLNLPHTSLAETEAMIRHILGGFASHSFLEWAVTLRGDDRVVGKVCHHRWMKEHFRSEIGYLLRRDLWRRGITTEALRAILELGFTRMELHSVEAQLDPENIASIRTLERLGFLREAHLRENVFARGRFWDTLIYSLVRR